MPKRITDEERIVDYFTNAPADRVDTLFNVIRGIVKGRTPKQTAPKLRKVTAAQAVRQASPVQMTLTGA